MKNMYSRLTFSQRPPPNALMKMWIWSPDAAQKLPTSPLMRTASTLRPVSRNSAVCVLPIKSLLLLLLNDHVFGHFKIPLLGFTCQGPPVTSLLLSISATFYQQLLPFSFFFLTCSHFHLHRLPLSLLLLLLLLRHKETSMPSLPVPSWGTSISASPSFFFGNISFNLSLPRSFCALFRSR